MAATPSPGTRAAGSPSASPTSWRSDTSLPLRYFGQDLVAFRGEDGVAHVLEAYCAHMGAHLGVGGKVEGCTLRCPFHGWRYDGSGACVEIPYARKIPPKAEQQAWPAHEMNGIVLVHHDPDGLTTGVRDPGHRRIRQRPVAAVDDESSYHIKTHPREIVDNLADKAHFAFVHKTAIDEFGFEVAGHTATQHVKGRAFLADGRSISSPRRRPITGRAIC